jgi:outer membrane biogenesis lipoprotein LolB
MEQLDACSGTSEHTAHNVDDRQQLDRSQKKLSDLTGLTNSGRMIQKGVIGD